MSAAPISSVSGSTAPDAPPAAPGEEATARSAQLVEHFFRHETGRLHGALVRLLGVQNLSLAEDVAQEALLRALRTWSMGGVPANPSAWITRVALNLAKDALRHQRMSGGKEPAIITHLELAAPAAPSPAVAAAAGHEIRDDALLRARELFFDSGFAAEKRARDFPGAETAEHL